MGFFKARVLLWPVVVLGVLALGLLGFAVVKAPAMAALFDSGSDRSSQVIQSVTRQQQVVLLSLGIQGIDDSQDAAAPFFGVEIPGSDRATFVKYEFEAKLGIDGEAVEITQTGEDSFLVSIPQFVFVGLENLNVELVAENNGLLSFLTPQIDPLEDDEQRRHTGARAGLHRPVRRTAAQPG